MKPLIYAQQNDGERKANGLPPESPAFIVREIVVARRGGVVEELLWPGPIQNQFKGRSADGCRLDSSGVKF